MWVPTVFTKNRDRLLEGDVARKFLAALLNHKRGARASVGRALLGRRHADRGLGVDEELPAEGRLGASRRRRAATASAISTARSAATRRTPRPPTPRPSCTARAKARKPSCASSASADGEPHGLVVEAELTRGRRARRARGGRGHDRAPFAGRHAHHARRRQGLRRGRLRRRSARRST